MGNDVEYALLTLLAIDQLRKRVKTDLPYVILFFHGVVLFRDKDHNFHSSLSRNLRHDEGK